MTPPPEERKKPVSAEVRSQSRGEAGGFQGKRQDREKEPEEIEVKEEETEEREKNPRMGKSKAAGHETLRTVTEVS